MLSRKSLLAAGFVLASIATPTLADSYSPVETEQEKTGFYGVLSVGVTELNDVDYDTTVSGTDYAGEADLNNDGAAYEIGLGYDFGNWRTDVIYSQSEHYLDSCKETKASVACTSGSGSGDMNSIMLNGYYDIPMESKYTPYIGAGIGTTRISPDNIRVNDVDYDLKTEDTFTYQLKAGVSYPIGDKTDLIAEGTYRKYSDLDSSTDVANVDYDVDNISSWGWSIGARYRF